MQATKLDAAESILVIQVVTDEVALRRALVGMVDAAFYQLADQRQASGLTPENTARIATELSRSSGVYDDEVAILKLEKTQLRFIHPPELPNVGMIPLTHSQFLAARMVNTKRLEVVNNFAQMRHASVFESVPVESKDALRKAGAKCDGCPKGDERAGDQSRRSCRRDSSQSQRFHT